MKCYLVFALVALILLSSSPSHQQEQRSGSSRREGEGVPRRQESYSNRPSGALLDKLRNLPRSATFGDLARELNVKLPSEPSHTKTVRMGGTLRVVDTTPSKIYCNTKQVCIPLPQPHDGSGIHWPFCAIVPQCSGCCDLMSNLLACKPVTVSNHTVQVMYIPYAQAQVPRITQVSVQAHEQCLCACRTDPSSCNANQFFNADHCRCECKQQSRKQCADKFRWNEDQCGCKCSRPVSICSSGKQWSDSDCGCVCKPRICPTLYTLDKSTCKCVDNMKLVFKKLKWPWGRK